MLVEEQQFNKIESLAQGRYEQCTFTSCNLENSNFSNFRFIDCKFEFCNLSLIQTTNMGVQNCEFKDCKMVGVRFDQVNSFNISFTFHACILDHSSFQGMKIPQTQFIDCSLKDINFENCDCKKSIFDNCNLENSIFYRSNLDHVDFQTAFNYSFDPEFNAIKNAKFSLTGLPGLLRKHKIKIIGN